jgi:UDP-N-acetyl-D-glucosamine dehydrogenase
MHTTTQYGTTTDTYPAPDSVATHLLASKTVCVQGLGFVGAANAIAVASARDPSGRPLYEVIGVDLDNELGRARVAALNAGVLPFQTSDQELVAAAKTANDAGNLTAVTDSSALSRADVIIVNVGVDIDRIGEYPTAKLSPFCAAINVIGQHMRPDALVLIETTIPPGTCERIVAPLLRAGLTERRLCAEQLQLAYCYERVMPGGTYLASIIDMWRVYAGLTEEAADRTAQFLSSYVDVKRKPLFRLGNIRSAEMAKILENTYRAVNIALIDEWERFARRIDVDLYAVLDSIRVRPTHDNIRYPGLGVGGYCLTKDPLFGLSSAREIFGYSDLEFPLSTLSVDINDAMPFVTVQALQNQLTDGLSSKRILILGATYRADVGDTRSSPTTTLVSALRDCGAEIEVTDPLAATFDEAAVPFHAQFPAAERYDIIILAVAHREYKGLDLAKWIGNHRPIVFDASGVLSRETVVLLRKAGFKISGIGRAEQ